MSKGFCRSNALLGASLMASVIGADHFVRYLHRPSQPFGGIGGADFFMEESDKGGGAGNEEEQKPARRNAADIVSDYNSDVVRMASKISDLESDNYKVRRQRDDAKRDFDKTKVELDAVKGKVPADGSVVLSKDDVEKYEAYKALGDDPAKLKTTIDSLETTKAENASIKRDQTLRDIADAAGFKFSVLKDRDERVSGLEYSIKEVEEDGKKVKRAFVKFKDGEGETAPVKEQTLLDYAEAKWPDFMPALRVEATNGSGNGSSGTRVVQQSSSQNAGTKVIDPTRSYLDAKYQRPDQRDQK